MKTRVDIVPLLGRYAKLGSVIGFFGFRAVLGMAIMLFSARALDASSFTTFTQLFLFNAYLSIIASGGTTNGIIRQVAAARSEADQHKVILAGLAITAVVGTTALLLLLMLGSKISTILIGTPHMAREVQSLGLITLTSGAGQIVCAVLTGQGRLTRSLAAQAIGLLVGSVSALVLIAAQHPLAAVFGFAGGPLITTILVLPTVSRSLRSKAAAKDIAAEIREQLHFAGAFLITASVPPLILFGLRQQYRNVFGIEFLSYWLAANRISDLSTQLIGLYATQIFLPPISAVQDSTTRLRLSRNAALLVVSISATAFAVYFAASVPLTRLFLSNDFTPAVPFIRIYLIGDIARSLVSVAMIEALSRRQSILYAGIEVGTMMLMAAITLGLMRFGNPITPCLGYASAYWAAATVMVLRWFLAYRSLDARSGKD